VKVSRKYKISKIKRKKEKKLSVRGIYIKKITLFVIRKRG